MTQGARSNLQPLSASAHSYFVYGASFDNDGGSQLRPDDASFWVLACIDLKSAELCCHCCIVGSDDVFSFHCSEPDLSEWPLISLVLLQAYKLVTVILMGQ